MSDSEILTAKISHGFDHLDADSDGRLTEHDHVLMGRRAAAALGHAPGSDTESRIVEAYVRIWRELHLPHIPGGGTAVTREHFLRSTRTLAADPGAAQATVGALAEAFLAITDIDRDGKVGPSEYRAFVAGHFPGLTEAEVEQAFAHMDTDGDGHLSAEEFVRATVDYWTSSDPDAPGNWFMGTPTYLR